MKEKSLKVLIKAVSKASPYYMDIHDLTDEEWAEIEGPDRQLMDAVRHFDMEDNKDTREAVREAAKEYRAAWLSVRMKRKLPPPETTDEFSFKA